MAVVHSTTRRRAFRPRLGDLSTDMHNAAMNAPTVNDLPSHAPYLTAYRYNGQVFIQMNNPADVGGDDTANWVGYTDAWYGVSESDKTAYAAAQGADVALPGWDAQRIADDPQGYAAAQAAYRASTTQQAAAVTQHYQTVVGAENATQRTTALTADAQNILDGWNAYRRSLAGEAGGPLPDMPPTSYTGPLDPDLLAILKQLVASQPPQVVTMMKPQVIVSQVSDAPLPPMPPARTTTTVLPVTTQQLPAVDYSGSDVPTSLVTSMPLGGGGPSGGGGSFIDSNGGMSMSPVMPPSGGGAMPLSDGGLSLSSPVVLGGIALLAGLALFGRHRRS